MTDVVGQAPLDLPGLGHVWVAWSERGVTLLDWADLYRGQAYDDVRVYKRAPAEHGAVLAKYARGASIDPAREIPVDLSGTKFQLSVWNALRRVPRGFVRTYAGIAADIARPRAMRAVGMANNRNPVAIIVPCHRIVASGYGLGGYGGGLDRKRRLLTLEGVKMDGDRLHPGQLALFE